jgi:hypothetical protein
VAPEIEELPLNHWKLAIESSKLEQISTSFHLTLIFGTTPVFTIAEEGVPDPHELLAVMEIVPPLEPVVTFMEVVVELPLHPDGKDQIYEVAPVTGEIL